MLLNRNPGPLGTLENPGSNPECTPGPCYLGHSDTKKIPKMCVGTVGQPYSIYLYDPVTLIKKFSRYKKVPEVKRF